MYKFFYNLLFITLLANCTLAQKDDSRTLPAREFSEKIREVNSPQILDVRTPGEFAKGHVADAFNVDWNGDDFLKKVMALDKSQPVFVYCLVGGRSASAAEAMRKNGFEKVYEMEGGMMQWRAAGLPEVSKEVPAKGMTVQQYQELLNSETLVLIDFNAPWCPPCKKMAPSIRKISNEMKDKVTVVEINVDENPELCKALHVASPPLLKLYKNTTLIWEHAGYIEETDILKQLK
ncbi:MAG TPA: thioredoxin domain-containing protein [Flavipsychrobacter sp.]|nr:thioredoxin domain-containing protein [Flavipsychrobacter sp.]